MEDDELEQIRARYVWTGAWTRPQAQRCALFSWPWTPPACLLCQEGGYTSTFYSLDSLPNNFLCRTVSFSAIGVWQSLGLDPEAQEEEQEEAVLAVSL